MKKTVISDWLDENGDPEIEKQVREELKYTQMATTRDDLLNYWLKKYHNTTVEEVVNTHSRDVLDYPEWFKLYPVTQEQCDEWEEWAKEELVRTNTISKWRIKNYGLGFIALDCAPYVKK
jgi:hypothetical protein